MLISSNIKIKLRHFIQNHYRTIILVVIIFMILIMINRFLIAKKYDPEIIPTTYKPNVAVLGGSKASVPVKVANSFEDFIEKYVGYCNNRNYVAAWNMISKDCKENFFGNDYDVYVAYVQQKFDGNTKRYAIQDYSNFDGKYIYNVKIFDDFLATGLTNQRMTFQEEKMVVSYDEGKNIIVAVGNYIGTKKLNYMASNDYIKIDVTEVIEKYNFQLYTVSFTNRSNYSIVIKDNLTDNWEIGLSIGNEIRPTSDDANIILLPGEKKVVTLPFEKFYDTKTKVDGIVFNAVRIMENYTGKSDFAEDEIRNAVDKFSMTVAF